MFSFALPHTCIWGRVSSGIEIGRSRVRLRRRRHGGGGARGGRHHAHARWGAQACGPPKMSQEWVDECLEEVERVITSSQSQQGMTTWRPMRRPFHPPSALQLLPPGPRTLFPFLSLIVAANPRGLSVACSQRGAAFSPARCGAHTTGLAPPSELLAALVRLLSIALKRWACNCMSQWQPFGATAGAPNVRHFMSLRTGVGGGCGPCGPWHSVRNLQKCARKCGRPTPPWQRAAAPARRISTPPEITKALGTHTLSGRPALRPHAHQGHPTLRPLSFPRPACRFSSCSIVSQTLQRPSSELGALRHGRQWPSGGWQQLPYLRPGSSFVGNADPLQPAAAVRREAALAAARRRPACSSSSRVLGRSSGLDGGPWPPGMPWRRCWPWWQTLRHWRGSCPGMTTLPRLFRRTMWEQGFSACPLNWAMLKSICPLALLAPHLAKPPWFSVLWTGGHGTAAPAPANSPRAAEGHRRGSKCGRWGAQPTSRGVGRGSGGSCACCLEPRRRQADNQPSWWPIAAVRAEHGCSPRGGGGCTSPAAAAAVPPPAAAT